jgi:pimeloyl-ACP methyl ester carboxylesterase
MKKTLAILCMCISFSCNHAQKVITGRWEGKLNADSVSLRMVFHFSQQSNGSYSCSMDSPDQGAAGIPCDKVIMHGDSVVVQVMSVGGRYDGLIINDSIIKGNWEQGREKVSVVLKKGNEVVQNTDSNCIETPVTLETKTGKIFGTLCSPKKFDKIPVALIIAGSGPTDRDGNNAMGLKTDAYKILAHKLCNQGIATLRYDKRGIAESKTAMKSEADLTFDDYINDANGWIEFLEHDKIFSKIIIIGHSEGSLIGMNAAIKDVDKYVSLAGAGERIDKTLKKQLASLPPMGRDTAYKMLDSLAKGKTVTHVDVTLYSLFRPSVQPYLISWIKHDPQVDIKKLAIPVLILQGTSDLQVDTNDARKLSVADPKAKLVFLKGMNHVLRDVGDDKEANKKSYADPTMPMDENLIKDIVDFIKE